MRRAIALLSAGLVTLLADAASAQNTPHNLILFVSDGLRGRIVTPETAPAMAEVRDKGVNFKNSHSIFPTVTTANASAIATGHYLGDTGDYGNVLYTEFPVETLFNSEVVFLEQDAVLREMREHYGDGYLGQQSLLAAARAAGYSTAVIGKTGPAA